MIYKEAMAARVLRQLRRRMASPFGYWLVKPAPAQLSEDARRFCEWIEAQAARTRAAMTSL